MTLIDEHHPTAIEPERVERPLPLLAAAATAGIAAEILFHPWLVDAAPVGLGFPLGIVIMVAGIVLGAARLGRLPDRPTWGLYGAAVAFAALTVARDSTPLIVVNVLSSMALLGLAVTLHNPGSARPRYVSDIAHAVGDIIRNSAFGPLLVAGRDLPHIGNWTSVKTRQLLGGIVLGIPLLVVFASLFMSADEVFGRAIRNLLSFNVPAVVRTALGIAVFLAWLVLGLLRGIMVAPARQRIRGMRIRFGTTEALTATWLVNGLFAVFIAFQLFEVVASYQSSDVAYAQLARNGFFELVTVAVLVVAAVLVFDWAVEDTGRRRLHRLQRVLVGLTSVVLVSAVVRMALYVEAFGLTRLRVHTTLFMIWIAFVLGWMVVTVLAGRREAFTRPAVAGLFVAVLVLNAINPDGLIAAYNLEHHPTEISTVDRSYLSEELSADAVPALMAHLDDFGDECAQLTAVNAIEVPLTGGVRSWNLARARAASLIESTRAQLAAACPR